MKENIVEEFYQSKFSLDRSSLKILYQRYRNYLVSISVIVICSILFLGFTIPQIQEVIIMRKEEGVVKGRIDILKNNLNNITKLDDSDTDSEFRLASSALPTEKDFVAVMNAVSTISVNSAVGIDDFAFQVGDLSTASAKTGDIPSLNIQLALRGGIKEAKAFIDALEKVVPIADVDSVEASGVTSKVNIFFYYRPIPFLTIDYSAPVVGLSSDSKAVLKKLSSWSQSSVPLESIMPQASPSGEL